MTHSIVRVALPVPLDKQFDYLSSGSSVPDLGARVLVSFGRQKLVGVVTELNVQSDYPVNKLKSIERVLDNGAILPESLHRLLRWCSQYYQYPLGETLALALPSLLRKGQAAEFPKQKTWSITSAGNLALEKSLKRAVKQQQVLQLLQKQNQSHQVMLDKQISSSVLNTLLEKKWVHCVESQVSSLISGDHQAQEQPLRVNEEQAIALAAINNSHGFGTFLLEGVTGSGKTEVYLQAIEAVLAKGKQALVLVPEIGLTPQTIQRFERRFETPICVVHSGLNDSERLQTWLHAKAGNAGVVIGTRSALFTPFKSLGLIVVDEEHDTSYKQQDSLRYHARDVAVMRANLENIPIILGSATPALETLQNALSGKYRHLILSQRAGKAVATRNRVLDVKGLYMEAGLSAPLIAEMRRHLDSGNQVLIFLNRRGFSPALMCHECGWIAECARCDAFYTYHQGSSELRCHRCGSQRPVIHQCGSCGSTQMVTMGVGTEQLQTKLSELFPEYSSIRIDRDSTRRKGSFDNALAEIHNNQHQLLIGTQMLAKGHHFPNVTLVALLDIDGALYSSDFRAAEKLAQLIVQVAGRAGRASKPGEVILQTHHPEHGLLTSLLQHSYQHFAESALKERKQAMLPPFSYLCLFKAEANQNDKVEYFFRQVKQILEASPLYDDSCWVLGPMPAPIQKRSGKYRWQLLLQCDTRSKLQKLISSAKPVIALLPEASKVRWSLDVEPQDMS